MFDGERYVPEFTTASISYEHWHRYLFASEFVHSKAVLDIACGEGYGTFYLSTSAEKVLGVDISAETIHQASSKYIKSNLEFIHGSATKIPVDGEHVFDVITSFETIEHLSVDEQEEFLKEVKRLLKPGGLFIISTPNKLVYSDIPVYKNEFHQKEFYIDEFEQFLNKSFKKVALLGENTYPISYVWPFSSSSTRLTEHRIKLSQNGFYSSSEAKQVLFVIAVCSDADLPDIGSFVQLDLSQQMLVERDNRIRELESELATEEEAKKNIELQLQALSTLKNQNESTIEILNARVSDRERITADLKEQLYQSRQEVLHLKEHLENEWQEKESANRTLALIYGSTAWRIVKILWAVRLFLAPHGSRREAFGRALSEIIQGIRSPLDFLRKPKEKSTAKQEEQPASTDLETSKALVSASLVHSEVYESMLTTAINSPGAEYVKLSDRDFPIDRSPIKLIAFYLPQFHPIPENDAWWGKGFTEWRNVSKAIPQFKGHYQPHLPGELGFYDLRIPEVQVRQVELAKKYGISGFCFYYYWFHGKRLLERPLDEFVANSDIDFPFCLCWANENWTRRWDGQESDILIGQEHSEESDMAFIRDILPYMQHKNYIKIDGRPVLIVYRVSIMPNPQATVKRWKNYCKSMDAPEPYLIAARTFGYTEYEDADFDASVEFPPHNTTFSPINDTVELLNPNFQGLIYDYREIVKQWANEYVPKLFYGVFPSWDNEPRKPGRGSTYAYGSPELYREWLKKACVQTLKKQNPDERIVFINAWNEWAEGAHLEPDQKFGYAYLQATADALASIQSRQPVQFNNWTILFISHDALPGGAQSVLLDEISWFREHTSIHLKIICLNGGDRLYRYEELADTLVLNMDGKPQETNSEVIISRILDHCGGKPDLIYANTVASGRILSVLSKLNVPILTHVHELETSIQKYAKEWIGDIFELSSHFIACSPVVRDNLLQTHHVNPDAITTIYASINPDLHFDLRQYGEREKWAAREKLNLMQDKFLVFGCGLSMPFRKGADLFIEAAGILLRKGYRDFHFYWIGDFTHTEADENNKIWGDYLKEMHENGLDRYVTFLGIKDNPREYLLAADIFVLPSREDPFPLVALEAADYALPVICFDGTGGIPQFVGDDAGYVVPFLDISAMAEKIILLMEDEELRRQKGSVAREKFLKNYTIDRTSPQVLSLCRKMAHKKPTVSVIVPNYNHAKYLPKRLDSIFQQTYRDFEVILLDDASTDNSIEVLEQYVNGADVRLIKNEKNTGSPCLQWIKGLDLANGEIVWIAESDDASEKGFIDALLPSFNDQNISLAYADSFIINENDTVVGDYLDSEYLTSLSPTKWRSDYLIEGEQEVNEALGVKNTVLNISSALLRKRQVDDSTREVLAEMRIAGDWYFIIQLIKDGCISYKASKLNYHRRHSESVIGKTISDKKIQDFFREFGIVQKYIFENYCLQAGFQEKWEAYLRKQWNDFYPNRSFQDLHEYYPFDEMEKRIAAHTKKSDPSGVL